jgi:undecaprenyl-diphosphatase
MPLFHVAVLAALQGLTEALPVSRSGHEIVARLWLDAGPSAPALETVLHLGTALGLVVAARRRLFAAFGEGVRAVTRPALFTESPEAWDAAVIVVAAVVSLVTNALTAPRVEMWSDSPTATGVGLLVSGLALASLALAPRASGRPRRQATGDVRAAGPSLSGAFLVGMAHGLAVFPGASRVGAAIVLLLWMGVRPARALDLAYLLTVPTLLVAFARGADARHSLETGTVILGLVLAFVMAMLGSEALRSLVERQQLARLALWTIPLGLAMLAYAHALPLPS